MHENTVHLLASQKRLKDKYKDPDMLFMINKADIAGMMETTEEYLRSYCGVVRVPLAYIIRKMIILRHMVIFLSI